MNAAIWVLSLLLSLILSSSTVISAEESVHFITFDEASSSEKGTLPLAVQLLNENLLNVSSSLLMAETWVRAHVLANYPSINISIIIVGHKLLCNKNEEEKEFGGLVLPAINNIYYSLTRWGLQNDIKVTTTFTSDCFDSQSQGFYRLDVAENYIKPLVNTLDQIGSPYVVHPPQNLNMFSDESETMILLKSHLQSMEKLGFGHMSNRINMIVSTSSPRLQTTIGRKLTSVDFSSVIDPFPQRPTKILIAPTHSPLPVVLLSPNPLPFAPSLSPVANPTIPPFIPYLAPTVNPATPPFGPHLPPCSPPEGGIGNSPVGSPKAGMHIGVWCVAKPSVPSETLQEALDFACGEGGADCEAITPQGSCYFPDSLVAHASYAFNSYWQKTKKNGGTCGFGGTAMLINADPSYSHCRFILT